MKKIIVKFWSVGLLLALLSTLFVGSCSSGSSGRLCYDQIHCWARGPTTFVRASC